jgi:hypothetical protein
MKILFNFLKKYILILQLNVTCYFIFITLLYMSKKTGFYLQQYIFLI